MRSVIMSRLNACRLWSIFEAHSRSCCRTTGGDPPNALPPWLTVGYRIECHDAPTPLRIRCVTRFETVMVTSAMARSVLLFSIRIVPKKIGRMRFISNSLNHSWPPTEQTEKTRVYVKCPSIESLEW
jgi:hypothetical protein